MIWSVLLLGGYLIVNVSGQMTITSSLQSRMYVCPGEMVTYVCNGTGDQIRLSAPPYVNSNTPVLYMREADSPGVARQRGPIVITLISTDSHLMVANLTVNSSLPEFVVQCTVLPTSGQAVARYKPSGTINYDRLSQ